MIIVGLVFDNIPDELKTCYEMKSHLLLYHIKAQFQGLFHLLLIYSQVIFIILLMIKEISHYLAYYQQETIFKFLDHIITCRSSHVPEDRLPTLHHSGPRLDGGNDSKAQILTQHQNQNTVWR